MEEKGIIRKSQSQYHCATVIQPKKNGKLRLCVDYRPVNAITKGMGQVLPRIGDLFAAMKGMKYFAALDLTSGYHQDAIRDEECSSILPSHYEQNPDGFSECSVLCISGRHRCVWKDHDYVNSAFISGSSETGHT
ncbi:hypothetical protein ADUPG1_002676, partial [Aduncisulcus paluster]